MKISLREELIRLMYSEVECMLGSIPYAKRKTSVKLSVDLWFKDILVFVRKEKLLRVFLSLLSSLSNLFCYCG